MRITILVEQALLGGETNSAAINLNGTAFEHHGMIEDRNSKQRRDLLHNTIVFFVGPILSAPTVKNPIVKRQRIHGTVSFNKRGAIVTHPDINGWNSQSRDILRGHPRSR